MSHNIIQQVEREDEKVLTAVAEHPSINNVEHAIQIITNIGVNAITYEFVH